MGIENHLHIGPDGIDGPGFRVGRAYRTDHQPAPGLDFNAVPESFFSTLFGKIPGVTAPMQTWAEHITSLDIQAGDRVRLTEAGRVPLASPKLATRKPVPDAAVLEGVVEQIGVRGRNGHGGLQIRIRGFGHTGPVAGGQHVWFPLTDYVVEVLHRAYRWTDRDHVIAELAGGSAGEQWAELPEHRRVNLREEYGSRANRIMRRLGYQLGNEDGGVE